MRICLNLIAAAAEVYLRYKMSDMFSIDAVTQRNLSDFCKGLATLATGYFSGTCMYISLSEYPALSQLIRPERLKAFAPIYEGAATSQKRWLVTTSVACVGSYFASEASERNYWWLGSGLLMASMMPYTVIFMYPTNYSLIDVEESMKKDNDWIDSTFSKWSKLHAVRTVVTSGVFCAMLYGLWKHY